MRINLDPPVLTETPKTPTAKEILEEIDGGFSELFAILKDIDEAISGTCSSPPETAPPDACLLDTLLRLKGELVSCRTMAYHIKGGLW